MRAARIVAILGAVMAMPLVAGVAPATATTSGTEITVHISPSSLHVGDAPITVSGVVSDSSSGTVMPVPNVSVTIQRTDSGGPYPSVPVTTNTDGGYSYVDHLPAVWKRLTYMVSLASDPNQQGKASVWVHRLATTLTIGSSRSVVASGRQIRVTAHLGSPTTNRTVTLYARPYRLDRYKLTSHAVDATSGNISATPTVRRRTTYSARFTGDDTYAPAVARVVVRARAVIGERLTGGYATEGAFRIYHAGAHPVLVAHLHPQLDGVCLWFKAQRRFSGSWHTVASRCFTTDASGYARGEFTGAHLDSPYRVRARWQGNRAALSRSGAWLKMKFR